jgi:hypothetical protein
MLILHMPALVCIDRHRTIRAQYEGDAPFFNDAEQEKNIRLEIEKLLKETNMSKAGQQKPRTARAQK